MFADIYESLTEEGQKEFLNNILVHAAAEDIIEGLYIQKQAEVNLDKPKLYSPMLPGIAASGLIGLGIGSAIEDLIPLLMQILSAKFKKLKPETIEKVKNLLQSSLGSKGLSSAFALTKAVKELKGNTDLANEDRVKLNEIYNKIKTASEEIDELYKEAKITVPSKEEAKKETKPKEKDDLPTITCENCGYEGKTTSKGECPECGAIGGVKIKGQEPSDNAKLYYEPLEGINVYEADTRARLEENAGV